ncbi:hypothetical protein V865_004063 [Kwoniella europaea PYCC6329]|uniref:Zn(2)-C6 fungal-type domain-containing protein n=1 Tax=Kwoniella europaea PYCC6329 TaxID=1423913 RepID=A0AAX4KKZ0_9TREE
MPRDITPPSTNRAPKRTRVYRACQYCVSAKTRCEDVRIDGCFICRRKGKSCSLAGLNSSAHSSGSHDGNADKDTNGIENGQGDLLEKIEGQEERYKQLEARFNQLEQRFISEHSRQVHDAQTSKSILNGHGHDDYHLDDHLPLPSKYLTKTSHPLLPQSWHGLIPVFDENLLNATDPNSLPDVVTSGLINKTQLEMGFQLFKHQFSSIYPFHTFLLTSTSVPSQSFINLVILYYISTDTDTDTNPNSIIPIDTPILVDLIEKSLMAILSGSTSAETIFALFILSFAPLKKSLSSRQHLSSLRMISLAYNLGKSSGWDQKMRLILRENNRNNLFENWSTNQLDLVLLWTAIINRYNILHIISTPIGHPIESPAPLIPSDHPSASESIRMTVSHLQKESDLVDRARGYLQTLFEVECEVEIEPDSLTRCTDQVAYFRKGIQDFRDGLDCRKGLIGYHCLKYDSQLIEFSLIMRLSILNQNLPSPFSPDLKLRGLSTIGTNYLPTSSALIDILLSQPNGISNGLPIAIGGLPSYVIQSTCLAYICLRRALFYIYSRRNLNQNEQVQYKAQIDLLARSQDILVSLGASPALLVDYTNQQLGQLGDLGSFLNDNNTTTENINTTNATNSHNNSIVSTNDHNHNHNQHVLVDNNHNTLDMTHTQANITIDWSNWDWSNLLVDPFSFDIGVGPVE